MKTINMIHECPACYSKEIDKRLVMFPRLIYFLDKSISRFKLLLGYRCKSCGYYINEDYEQIVFIQPKK